ncbi:MAG: ATP synthase F1 subunit gamma [Candidatus Paceibacterota bacterium]|jgi:F-type H+-transporting ATPase subunit gamma
MAGNILEIKKQLKSLKNSAKITKAVELVAGSKMRRSVGLALKTKSYSNTAWKLARRLAGGVALNEGDPLFNFLAKPKSGKETVLIVVTSNRGLCGAFNVNVVRAAMAFIKKQSVHRIICIGKKGAELLRAKDIPVDQVYEKDDSAKQVASVKNVSDYIYSQVKAGVFGKVFVAYTDFKSALRQTPVLRLVFPFNFDDTTSHLIENAVGSAQEKDLTSPASAIDFLFEPSPKEILERLIPNLAETLLFQTILESNAAEHSARMFAMKNATDVALEMHEGLLLVFNKTRQASITKELAEISAGRMALEG